MKKKLNAKRLNELSEKAKDKLWLYLTRDQLETRKIFHDNRYKYLKDFGGRMTIGSMIEFLIDHSNSNDYRVVADKDLLERLWEEIRGILEED